MEFNKKLRPALATAAVLAAVTLGSFGVESLVTTAMAGNAPSEIVAKPPCVMQPKCRAAAAGQEEPASAPALPPTLDTLAMHAALQNPSVFGLLRVLREPDPGAPHQKWCKNVER